MKPLKALLAHRLDQDVECPAVAQELLDRRLRRLVGPQGAAIQYAALPYRFSGQFEILLVTSRDTGRWVLPKGWPMKGKKPHAAAEQEAFEEAGVKGRICKTPIGGYRYGKRLANGAVIACTVQVFPLLVERQKKQWPEQGQRTAHWFSPQEAAEAVNEVELSELIMSFVRQTSRV